MTVTWRIDVGDCRELLAGMDEGSVQTCVTSPPYFGLRDYGVDGQLGLETTPDEFVEAMVAVFREVRRVLRDDGTLWLNLGDSYSGGANSGTTDGPPVRIKNLPIKRGEGIKPKDLIGIPWMVAFALRADGWFLRSDIIWHKPNPMPESVTDRPTRAHEYLFLLAKGQWKTRVVPLADLRSDRVHLGQYVGSQDPHLWAHEFGVRLATAILDRPEFQKGLSLPPLDSQVWEQRPSDCDGFGVAGLPVEHRAAVFAARLLSTHGTAKEFLCELDGLGVALAEHNQLLIGGGAAVLPLPPGVDRYGETAIAIHHPGEVGKLDWATHTVDCSKPSGCSYFYDADAIREDGAGRLDLGRMKQPDARLGEGGGWAKDGTLRDEAGRNKRDVWTVATQPFSGAHFAAFPPKLIEPCILAGAPEGGVVLDPFAGAGTTGLVALRHNRSFVGCELNPEYAELARDRIRDDAPLLNTPSEVAA